MIKQPTTNIMEKLPQEIVLRILSMLPVTSLLESMLVCRAWQRLVQDPFLVATHFSHMADQGLSFIFQSDRPNSMYQLFFIDFSHVHRQGKVLFKKIPADSTTDMFLVDSCNGLLCMRDARGISIYNPFTRFYLNLPKLHYPAQVGHIAFGFLRTTKQYKVVLSRLVLQSEVYVLTIGDPSWRNIGTLSSDLTRSMPSVLVNGRLHWLSKPNNNSTVSLLVSFDLETEQFHEVPKPDCCVSASDRCLHHLMVLRGCLSAGAYHVEEDLEIWVMKEYGVKESWIKEFSIQTDNYLPPSLHFQQTDLQHFNNAKARFLNSCVRVLCVLSNDEILLEYPYRAVVVFDHRHGTFKELTFPEMPDWYTRITHVGSLNWIDTPLPLD